MLRELSEEVDHFRNSQSMNSCIIVSCARMHSPPKTRLVYGGNHVVGSLHKDVATTGELCTGSAPHNQLAPDLCAHGSQGGALGGAVSLRCERAFLNY